MSTITFNFQIQASTKNLFFKYFIAKFCFTSIFKFERMIKINLAILILSEINILIIAPQSKHDTRKVDKLSNDILISIIIFYLPCFKWDEICPNLTTFFWMQS